jgi:peptidoglycan/LPS O-acetylase OafA/YrhL
MTGDKAKVYFPGLNGLRFFAALAVIITHVELLKGQLGFTNRWQQPFFYELGGLGVYFFFVLSGFLITYLLLVERKQTGAISIRDFYMRRIFRIWPVYYLLLILAFFVFPHIPFLHLHWLGNHMQDHFWLKFVLYFFLMPNMALAFFHGIPHAGQAWSIGVEEQFYIIWPWVVRKSKNLMRTIILFAVGIVLFKIIIHLIASNYPNNYVFQSVKAAIAMTKMECMAIGGIGAILLFEKRDEWLRCIQNPFVQLASYLSIPLLIFFTPEQLQDGIHLVYSFAFLVIILNIAANQKSMLKLENKFLNFLGNISYGLYMYHMFILVFVIRLVSHVWKIEGWQADLLHYGMGILLTIAFSALSYYLYEKPFIRLKHRFSRILSGSDAKQDSL